MREAGFEAAEAWLEPAAFKLDTPEKFRECHRDLPSSFEEDSAARTTREVFGLHCGGIGLGTGLLAAQSARQEASLQRNLIYTGITRGKRLAVVAGQRKALGIAVRNDRPQRRHSGLLASLRNGGSVASA
jgi:hypothetical protein